MMWRTYEMWEVGDLRTRRFSTISQLVSAAPQFWTPRVRQVHLVPPHAYGSPLAFLRQAADEKRADSPDGQPLEKPSRTEHECFHVAAVACGRHLDLFDPSDPCVPGVVDGAAN